MKIYISIPITGHDQEKQREKAEKIAEEIIKRGGQPVNPFDTPAPPEGLSPDQQYAYYIGCDISQLLMCDAILMSEGWQKSKGCCIEYAVASEINLIIFDEDMSLITPDESPKSYKNRSKSYIIEDATTHLPDPRSVIATHAMQGILASKTALSLVIATMNEVKGTIYESVAIASLAFTDALMEKLTEQKP